MTPAKPATDAFAQLMASRSRQEVTPRPKRSDHGSRATGDSPSLGFRMALGAYIADPNPSNHPPSTIIYSNDGFVALRDKFPKATVHALLLPRSAAHSLLHPFDAFEDAEFLASVRVEAERLKALAASELQRKLGVFSRTECARQAVLDEEEEEEDEEEEDEKKGDKKEENEVGKELPPGRDWAAEIKCGVHACPSMAHLHVHVFSRDMHSPAMRHRKHYNSFNTPFLVDLADLPLHELDPRRHPTRQGYLGRDLKCWRCHENFGNRFKELKSHVEQEFDDWKAE